MSATTATIATTMPPISITTSTVPVKGKLRFIPAGKTPKSSKHYYHLPETSVFSDERMVQLHDIRPVPTIQELPNHPVQLDKYGFTAIRYPLTLHSPPYTSESAKDPALVKKFIFPETAEMLRRTLGCTTVIPTLIVLRGAGSNDYDNDFNKVGESERDPDGEDQERPPDRDFPQFIGFDNPNGGTTVASKTHLDYSPEGARGYLRHFHPELVKKSEKILHHEDLVLAEGKNLREHYVKSGGPRWGLYSIWRPLKTVKRDPLTVGDWRTFDKKDHVSIDGLIPRLGREDGEPVPLEGVLLHHSDGQKWHWIERMEKEEVLILRFFDTISEETSASVGAFHSSVEIPGTENEENRESMEMRILCIWD